jgi:hypothetical protein
MRPNVFSARATSASQSAGWVRSHGWSETISPPVLPYP